MTARFVAHDKKITARFVAHDVDKGIFHAALYQYKYDHAFPWNPRDVKAWFLEEVGMEIRVNNGQYIPYRLVDPERFVMFKLGL